MKHPHVFIATLLILFGRVAQSQTYGSITGRITDESSDDGVPSANVLVKGTQIGSATDAEGHYHITGIPAGVHTLVVSSVGYESTEVEDVLVSAGGGRTAMLSSLRNQ